MKAQVSYFIADLHLTEDRPEMTACFLSFIKNDAIEAEALYILGDFFEVWLGDDNKTKLTETIAAALLELNKSGTSIYYIHGNRDFLLGHAYAKRAGMQLLPEQQVIDLYGEPALIMHGDTLCTQDVDYQKFRKTSRSWWWRFLMLSLPLRIRQRIANSYREKSKIAQQNKSMSIMDVTPSEVVNALEKSHCQLLIHGHTHRPNIHHLTANNHPAKRIVLGDWYEQGAWLKASPGKQTLLNQPFG